MDKAGLLSPLRTVRNEDFLRGIRQLTEDYGIYEGKGSDTARRRITCLVSDYLLTLPPEEVFSMLDVYRSIAGPGIKEHGALLFAVALFEGNFYRALQDANLECSPTDSELIHRESLKRGRGRGAYFDPLKLHDIAGAPQSVGASPHKGGSKRATNRDRHVELSRAIIEVLRGTDTNRKEKPYDKREPEPDLVGATIGIGASSTLEWDAQDETWGL